MKPGLPENEMHQLTISRREGSIVWASKGQNWGNISSKKPYNNNDTNNRNNSNNSNNASSNNSNKPYINNNDRNNRNNSNNNKNNPITIGMIVITVVLVGIILACWAV